MPEVCMDKEILTAECDLNSDDIYSYNIYHTYTHLSGLKWVIIACIAFVVALVTSPLISKHPVDRIYTILYVLLGAALIIKQRIDLKIASIRQGNTEHLKYEFLDEGLRVSADGDGNNALLPWANLYKAVRTKKQLLIYHDRNHAYIIPDRCTDKMPEITGFLKKHMADHQLVRI
jgi:uncharacterized membrane protein